MHTNHTLTEQVACINEKYFLNDRKQVSARPDDMRPLSPIHTADADATQLSSWVASAVCTHQLSVVTQFPIFCASHRLHSAEL